MTLPDVRVAPLAPALRTDFLAFFDHERGPAFADNPAWAKCYCHYYEVPPAIVWESLDGPANRAAMSARIDSGEMEGFLAYVGDEVVGWCNAQPYPKLRHACTRLAIPAPPLPVAPHDAAAIVCFVIAPAWRRHRVATALLAGALANFAARGLALVDAFPWNTGPDDVAPADHYHGPLSVFVAAGFAPLVTHAKVTVVRKLLR
jgi:ribosomal protein S18 acetylase RimI-like enzyme